MTWAAIGIMGYSTGEILLRSDILRWKKYSDKISSVLLLWLITLTQWQQPMVLWDCLGGCKQGSKLKSICAIVITHHVWRIMGWWKIDIQSKIWGTIFWKLHAVLGWWDLHGYQKQDWSVRQWIRRPVHPPWTLQGIPCETRGACCPQSSSPWIVIQLVKHYQRLRKRISAQPTHWGRRSVMFWVFECRHAHIMKNRDPWIFSLKQVRSHPSLLKGGKPEREGVQDCHWQVACWGKPSGWKTAQKPWNSCSIGI